MRTGDQIKKDREFLETTERMAKETRESFAALAGVLDWMRSKQRALDGLAESIRRQIEADEAALAAEVADLDGESLDVMSSGEVSGHDAG